MFCVNHTHLHAHILHTHTTFSRTHSPTWHTPFSNIKLSIICVIILFSVACYLLYKLYTHTFHLVVGIIHFQNFSVQLNMCRFCFTIIPSFDSIDFANEIYNNQPTISKPTHHKKLLKLVSFIYVFNLNKYFLWTSNMYMWIATKVFEVQKSKSSLQLHNRHTNTQTWPPYLLTSISPPSPK